MVSLPAFKKRFYITSITKAGSVLADFLGQLVIKLFFTEIGFSNLQADLLENFSANIEVLANLAEGFAIFSGFN